MRFSLCQLYAPASCYYEILMYMIQLSNYTIMLPSHPKNEMAPPQPKKKEEKQRKCAVMSKKKKRRNDG